MRTKIGVDQLQLGMFLERMEGRWLDHPFWKSRFVLQDPEDLRKLRVSSITEVWIDTARGLSPQPAAPADGGAGPTGAVKVPAPVPVPVTSAVAAPRPVSVEQEAERAAALCQRSKQAVESMYRDARMGRALDAQQGLSLVDEIAESIERNAGALIGLARLKTHDNYSYMHSVAVCALMVSLGRRLGLDPGEVREAGMAGLVHDLGKAVLPLAVLNKPGALAQAEFELVKSHPRRGHDLLREGQIASEITLDVCLHHHERPDGRGYPDRLSGAALSLHARMGALCDVYDAITSDRPYKAGWDPAVSIARMAEWTREGQFDPLVYRSFVECIGIYPVGALVRLQSGRLALVIEQNPAALIAPRVREFYSIRSQMPIPPRDVDLSLAGCKDRIVARESNEQWKFTHLASLVPGHVGAAGAPGAAPLSGTRGQAPCPPGL